MREQPSIEKDCSPEHLCLTESGTLVTVCLIWSCLTPLHRALHRHRVRGDVSPNLSCHVCHKDFTRRHMHAWHALSDAVISSFMPVTLCVCFAERLACPTSHCN